MWGGKGIEALSAHAVGSCVACIETFEVFKTFLGGKFLTPLITRLSRRIGNAETLDVLM
jgi:hypothetical protein